jgi:hypothetical protein
MSELNYLALRSDANLIGYWRLEGNSTHTTAGPDGTDTAITYGIANGRYQQGASLNGSTSTISFGNNLGIANGSPISIAFWAKPAGTTDKDIIIKSGTDSSTTNYTAGVFGGKWAFGYHPALSDQVWKSGTTPSTTKFTHVCYTYTFGTGSSLKEYLDGVDTTSGGSWNLGDGNGIAPTGLNALYFASPSSAKLYLGSFYSGLLDDVCIFSRILTAAEVQSLYADNRSPSGSAAVSSPMFY